MHSFSKRNQSLLNHSVLLFLPESLLCPCPKSWSFTNAALSPKRSNSREWNALSGERSLRSIGSELRAHHASCLFLPTIMQLRYSLTPRDLLGLLYPQILHSIYHNEPHDSPPRSRTCPPTHFRLHHPAMWLIYIECLQAPNPFAPPFLRLAPPVNGTSLLSGVMNGTNLTAES